MTTTDAADADSGGRRGSAPVPVRLAWGVLGVLLLAWSVFEVIKHMGWVIPAALLGAALPVLSRLLRPRAVPLHNLLNRAVLPFAVMVASSFLGDAPEDIAAPFTFGMAWLTGIAVARAVGVGGRPVGRDG